MNNIKPGNTPDMIQVLQSHISRYPLLQLQDIYKLLYQAAMGAEHAVPSPAQAKKYLLREIKTMGPGPSEPLCDPISPHITRIHLRPYLSQNLDINILLNAFLKTAKNYTGSIALLKTYWQAVYALNHFPHKEANAYFTYMEQAGFHAVHHSDPYRKAYKPAYRIILREYASPISKP